MQLDGYPIHPGDAVYDTAFGPGRVQTVDTVRGVVTAKFGHRQAGYVDGVTARFNVRTLFWNDPVLMPPPKQTAVWKIVRVAVQAMAKSLTDDGYGVDGGKP